MELVFRNTKGFEYISPNVVGAEVSEDIVFTDRAMNELVSQYNKIIDDTFQNISIHIHKSHFVRLYLVSTHSKAKRYSIKFDNVLNEFDRTFELRKLKVVIDRKHLFYFMGMLIDYVDDGVADGFVFYDTADRRVKDYYGKLISDNEIISDDDEIR